MPIAKGVKGESLALGRTERTQHWMGSEPSAFGRSIYYFSKWFSPIINLPDVIEESIFFS